MIGHILSLFSLDPFCPPSGHEDLHLLGASLPAPPGRVEGLESVCLFGANSLGTGCRRCFRKASQLSTVSAETMEQLMERTVTGAGGRWRQTCPKAGIRVSLGRMDFTRLFIVRVTGYRSPITWIPKNPVGSVRVAMPFAPFVAMPGAPSKLFVESFDFFSPPFF